MSIMSVTACGCQGFRLSLRELEMLGIAWDILGSMELLACFRAQKPVTRSQVCHLGRVSQDQWNYLDEADKTTWSTLYQLDAIDISIGIRSCRKHGVYGCLWYVYGMSIRLSQCLNMFKSLRKCGKLMMQCLALPLLCPDLMASFDRNPQQRGSLLAPFHALPNWLQTTLSRKKDGESLWNILEIRWNRMN